MSHLPAKRKWTDKFKSWQNVCEYNYVHVCHLLSDFNFDRASEKKNVRIIHEDGISFTAISELSVHPYTTCIKIEFFGQGWPEVVKRPEIEVRLYHDINIAEVVSARACAPILHHYCYPNPEMHQPDEKFQLNHLLYEWLGFISRF